MADYSVLITRPGRVNPLCVWEKGEVILDAFESSKLTALAFEETDNGSYYEGNR